MKVVGGTLAFVAFVVALVVGARFGAAAVDRPSTSASTTVPPSRAPAASAAARLPARRSQHSLDEPRPLPALFVVRDGKREGTQVALAGPRPKPALLHLWASWCGPCREELPSLLQLGRQGRYDVVAVSVDDDFRGVVQFFAGNIPPEVAWDPKITLEPALGVRSLPTTFLVDTQGVVRMRFDGMQQWGDASLQRELARELP